MFPKKQLEQIAIQNGVTLDRVMAIYSMVVEKNKHLSGCEILVTIERTIQEINTKGI